MILTAVAHESNHTQGHTANIPAEDRCHRDTSNIPAEDRCHRDTVNIPAEDRCHRDTQQTSLQRTGVTGTHSKHPCRGHSKHPCRGHTANIPAEDTANIPAEDRCQTYPVTHTHITVDMKHTQGHTGSLSLKW
ncbi:hypothetical protein ACOMHN_045721 [Nucella lapillus]